MVIRVKHVLTLMIFLCLFLNYGAGFHSVFAKSSKRDYNRSRHEYQEYIEKKSLTDGYYKYRTNPRPDTVPWVITGAIKVNKLDNLDEISKLSLKGDK